MNEDLERGQDILDSITLLEKEVGKPIDREELLGRMRVWNNSDAVDAYYKLQDIKEQEVKANAPVETKEDTRDLSEKLNDHLVETIGKVEPEPEPVKRDDLTPDNLQEKIQEKIEEGGNAEE